MLDAQEEEKTLSLSLGFKTFKFSDFKGNFGFELNNLPR